MATFPANGFEINEDDPQVPLIAILAAQEKVKEQLVNSRMNQYPIELMIENLGIPMHILAETDQRLHEE